MKIETKFEKGEKVWVIDDMTHTSPCKCCHTLLPGKKWVMLGIRRIDGFNIQEIEKYEESYFIENNPGDTFAWKQVKDLFRTEKEAEAECRKRNKEAENE